MDRRETAAGGCSMRHFGQDDVQSVKPGMKRVYAALLIVLAVMVAQLGLCAENGPIIGWFASAAAEPVANEEIPPERDGSKIEGIKIHWITTDSVSDNNHLNTAEAELADEDHLYLATSSDQALQMRYQLEVSFSGQYNYAPGDIQITVPAQVWSSRDGKPVGNLSLSVPPYPSTKADFNYQRVGDNYVLTNTRTLNATDKSMFQFTIYNLIPHTIVDMSECSITARCEVVTNKGNLIARDSNTITGQIDTIEKINSTYKTGKLYEKPVGVPDRLLENLPADDQNPDNYIYVNWTSWVYYGGNQPFSLKVDDMLDAAYEVEYDKVTKKEVKTKVTDGIFLGCTNYNGQAVGDTIDFETDIVKNTYDNPSGNYRYPVYFWSAYKKDKFRVPNANEPEVLYKMYNDVKWTLTEMDDEVPDPNHDKPTDVQLVTTAEDRAEVSYAPIKWKRPTGWFGTDKWTEYYNNKDYLYGYALNRLQRGEDVDMNFIVRTRGKGYGFTLDPDVWLKQADPDTGKIPDEVLDGLSEDDYGRSGWKQITEDRDTFFNYSEVPLTSRDFQFKALRIQAPTKYRYAKNNSGVWEYTQDNTLPTPDLTIEYQLDGDQATNTWRHAARAVWGTDGRGALTFQDVAEGITVSGSTVYFPENTTDVRHIFTSNIVNGQRPASGRCELAEIVWDVFPVITLKASTEVITIVNELFKANNDEPETKFKNDVYMDAYAYITEDHPDGVQVVKNDMDYSRATFNGANYGVRINKWCNYNPLSIYDGGDNDVDNHRVRLHYSARVTEQSNLKDRLFYNEAVEQNVIPADTSCIWYDLLPERVEPDLDTIRLRNGDRITAKYTIPNFRNTKRTMLVVEVDLQPQAYGTSIGFVDEPALYFDAYFTWEDMEDLGDELVNYIAYESTTKNLRKNTLGTRNGQRGEPDTPASHNNTSTPHDFPQYIIDALTDLDPTTDENRFLYASAPVRLSVDKQALSGINKKVASDLVGNYTQGLRSDKEKVTVYEGHTYTYRMRVKSADNTTTRDIVVYDTLENYQIPNPADTQMQDATKKEDFEDTQKKMNWVGRWNGKGQWRGTLEWVDLSDLVHLGVKPRLYYSTVLNLQFDDSVNGEIFDDMLEIFQKGSYNLAETTFWTEVEVDESGIWIVPEDLKKNDKFITGIAVDARKKADGTDFVLQPLQMFDFYLHMRAPDDNSDPNTWIAKGAYAHKLDEHGNQVLDENGDPVIDWEAAAADPLNNMYAYNNTRLKCVQENAEGGGKSTNMMIRNDYTRVGILPGIVRVTKEWNDHNNHDGLRPDSVTVTLKRRVAGSGQVSDYVYDAAGNKITAELNEENGWKYLFKQVDLVNAQGEQYIYSFEEANVEGYTSESQMIDNSTYKLINTHPNAKVYITGTKTWDDNDNAASLRPETVTLYLCRDGERIKSTTIRLGRDGVTWRYDFGELDKYAEFEEGGEVHEYKYTIEEEYVPKYVLEGERWDAVTNKLEPIGDLEVLKTLQDATEAAKAKEFTFTLMLFEEPEPVIEEEGEEGEEGDAEGGNEEEEKKEEEPPRPLEGEFDSAIYQLAADGETWELVPGTERPIKTRDTFKLKGGQKLVVRDLPSESTYEVTEANLPGFTLVSSDGSTGAIQAGRTQTAEFVNRYAAEAHLELRAQKTLTGHKLRKNQFRFTLTDITDPEPGEPGVLVSTAVTNMPKETTGGSGEEQIVSVATADFGRLTYTQADDGKTFTYRVAEVNEGKAGYTYDTTLYTVEVKLADNGDGTMTLTAVKQGTNESVLTEDGSALAFTNAYEAEGELVLKAWKVLEVRDLKNEEFSFELLHYNEETGVGDLIETVKNDADGNVVFTALTFDQDDVSLDEDNPAQYCFAVCEREGSDDTVIYSNLKYIFKITVYDNNDGTLSFAQENQVAERLYEDCETCHGKGIVHGAGDGSNKPVIGSTTTPTGHYTETHPLSDFSEYFDMFCDQCKGLCYIDGQICPTCKGSGLKIGGYYVYNTGSSTKYVFLEIVQRPEYGERAWMRKESGFYTQAIPEGVAASGLVCPDCDGTGKREAGMGVTGPATIPVFTNKLKDGALSVTKLVQTNPHPEQRFTFHVQLTGENLPQTLHYTLSQVQTRSMLRAAGSVTPAVEPFHATAEQLKGEAFAVLDKTTHEFVFFRSELKNGKYVDHEGREFTAPSTRNVSGDLIYYKVNESDTNRSDKPWNTDRLDIVTVKMKGAIRPGSCAHLFLNCSNMVSADLSLLDTSASRVAENMFKGCSSLTALDTSRFEMNNNSDFDGLFQGCAKLEYLDLRHINTVPASSNGYRRGMLYGCKNLKKIDLGPNTIMSNSTWSDGGLLYPKDEEGNTVKWLNMVTGEEKASGELFLSRNPGTWVADAPHYKLNFAPGEGGAGAMQTQVGFVKQDLTVTSTLYNFGHKLTGFRDNKGKFYTATADGTITIKADTYEKDEEVTLTAVWEEIDTNVTLDDGAFTFTLLGNETATFGDLPAGISYKVWEDTPAGWVLVEQVNENGVIEPLETSAAAFTNEYNPNQASIYLSAIKLRDGKTPVNIYSFTLSEVQADGTLKLLDTKQNKPGGAVDFDPITYSQTDVGTHEYILAEVEGIDHTIAYDASQFKATVVVADDGKGNLTASVTYKKMEDGSPTLFVPPTFRNFTKPGNLKLMKEITGTLTDKAREQEFRFVVTFTDAKFAPWTGSPKIDGVDQTLDENGSLVVKVKGGTDDTSIAANAVVLTDIPAGITYTVRELSSWIETDGEGNKTEVFMPGWTVDTDTETGAIPADDTAEAQMSNSYSLEGKAMIEINKALIGRQPQNEEFTFVLKDGDTVIDTATNDTNGVVRFDELTFTEEVTGKQYTISEVAGTDDTVEYSTETVIASVTMTDVEGQGRLTPKVEYSVNGEEGNTIANKVKPGSLSITKTVKDASRDTAFTFEVLLTAEGNLVNGRYPTRVGETEGTLIVENGKATFDLFIGESITINDLPKSVDFSVTKNYTPYTVTEGETTRTVSCLAKDTLFEFELALTTADGALLNDTYHTKRGAEEGELTVTDGKATFTLHDGETLVIDGLPDGTNYNIVEKKANGYTVSYNGATGVIVANQQKDAKVTNTYHAVGTCDLSATKILNGATLTEKQFLFNLKNADGEVLQTASNAADGSVTFEPLTFDEADIGELHYTVSEVNNSVAGIRYDETVYNVTIKVEDNGNGTLKVTPIIFTVDEDEKETVVDEMEFTNSYSDKVSITATKVWVDDEEKVSPHYDIEITLFKQLANGGERTVVPDPQTIPMDAPEDQLTVTWNNLPLYETDAGGQRVEILYSVEEKMLVPENEKNPYITIITGDVGKGFTITNRYSEVEVNPRAIKVLEGRELEAGKFRFVIKDAAGNVIDNRPNLGLKDDGMVVFNSLVYTPADLDGAEWDADKGIRQKTLKYTMEEVKDTYPGFEYDKTVYDLTVTLTETTDGELKAELAMALNGEPVEKAVFKNKFLTTNFEVKKKWIDGNGGLITLTLYANGVVVSPQPEYTHDGDTYSYTNLPMYDDEGNLIVYSAKEQFMDGFMTVYENETPYQNESDMVYNGGTIINRAVTSIRVRKVWSGLEDGEEPPKIVLKLYCNGELMERTTPKPDRNGWYTYYNLPKTYKGQPAVYTVVEEPVPGFQTSYMQLNGEDLGYVMDGGTITNYRVPKTGDQARIGLWLTMAALALLGMALLARKRAKKR